MAEEFMKIGGSPSPGITLIQVLRGHIGRINRIAWSPDGRYLASPSEDETIRIWDIERGKCAATLKEHSNELRCITWSPDGFHIASAEFSNPAIWIWDINTVRIVRKIQGQTKHSHSIIWSSDGQKIASGSEDNIIWIWNSKTGELIRKLEGHSSAIQGIAWSPNERYLVSASVDQTVRVWDIETGTQVMHHAGHKNEVMNSHWSPDGRLIASSSFDKTISIWDVNNDHQISTLEGHADEVVYVCFSNDGQILASKSIDNTVRIWRADTWETILSLPEVFNGDKWHSGIAFHPYRSVLATLGQRGQCIRIWNLNYDTLLRGKPATKSIRYTTAKLVLVGDSGVGKTGLGWRLAHNEFKEHSSTHGQQFWVVPELKKTRVDGTECEAVLWDLAGQHIYRSIHSIFLDDVDASLVLFDPTNRQEPLKGAQFWLEQLKGKKQLPPSVLVGARLDRGAPVLSQQELDQFCQKYGISGGYVGTSAKSGEGLHTLLETLKAQIPWDQMTTTVTTVTFKRIKEFVLSLKERPDREGVLVRPNELRKQLQAIDKDWQFTETEMMTAVGHLANHGYVTILKSSSGEEHILLVPELLASVASSIFLHADKHPRELGAINETELLRGKYSIDEFKGLEKKEQQVLLDATVVRFLEHSICFRESYGSDNLLIFPSLIKQKRPLKDDISSTDDISYVVRGRVENLYAMLVVLLGYTPSFNRIN
jgi:small GTP-binding protein